MNDLIVNYFKGNITEKEKEILFSRITKEEDLKSEFASFQNIYALTALLPIESDVEEGFDKLMAFKQILQKNREKAVFPLKQIMGYAATLCIAIFSTWAIMNIQKKEDVVTYEELTVPPGQRAHLKLSDGTTVWLNARSFLRYPNHFSQKERFVELNGEAFFDVKENKDCPFIISTEMVDIKVLGTRFNVFAYKGQDEFNTSLIKGSVQIQNKKNPSDTLILSPNERAEMRGNKLEKHSFKETSFLLWQEGIYTFNDIPFNEIIKKLELYYDIPIKIQNKEIEKYKFSGKFRQRDGIVSVLRTLQKVKYFAFIKDDELNTITIK
ncbi:FecR family protein [Parabacteroides sp. Marseille-P3160]|uniref:FecR family protein n=1 Tax=Parabacteroides sp. Marseille-P3160 TaxID=1917887 RepID=UPI0009B9454A|nr:FecR family protein [Parabacteroides sp. Marseille-P3160]